MKFAALLLCSLAALSSASAALVIKVDFENKEYYLTGSATGLPEENWFSGRGQIAWDNGQTLDGGYVEMLSESAFTVENNASSGSFILFLHGNGNANGAFDFESAELTTLLANPIRFDYSWWATELQEELEGKATAGESVGVANSASGDFALQFESSAVPEPSSGLLVAGAVGGFLLVQRNRRTKRRNLL